MGNCSASVLPRSLHGIEFVSEDDANEELTSFSDKVSLMSVKHICTCWHWHNVSLPDMQWCAIVPVVAPHCA